MEKRELICIGCPMGCPLSVSVDGHTVSVTGNTCPHGKEYAEKEVTAPTRVVTSTVKILNADLARVSVKTEKDIPKEKIFECMAEIRRASVTAPVAIGDIVIENVAGTGVNVIATKNAAAVNP